MKVLPLSASALRPRVAVGAAGYLLLGRRRQPLRAR